MGQIAVITGGSSGIGFALAKLLVEDHYSLALIARDTAKLEEAKTALLKLAPPDVTIATNSVDVANEDGIKRAIAEILERFGKIDLLVTSAGNSHPGYFEDQDNDTFRDSFNVNFFGSLFPVRSVLPHMKQRKNGKILFIASGAALIGIFGSSSYCSSKFAIRGLAEVLRSECKPHGIQVSIAYPPDTDTPMLHRNVELKPWEAKLIMRKGGMFTADQVARSIYRKLRQGKFALTTGVKLFLLNRLKSLVYPRIFNSHDRDIARERRKNHKSHSH